MVPVIRIWEADVKLFAMVSVPFDVKEIFPDVVVSALFIARVEAPAALLKTVRVPAVRAPFTVNPVLPYKKALLEIVRALLIVTAPPRLLDVVQLRLPAPTQALKVVVGGFVAQIMLGDESRPLAC